MDAAEAVIVYVRPVEAHVVDTRDFAAQIEQVDRLYEPDTSRIGEITHVLDHEPAFNKLAHSGGDLVDQALTYLAEPDHTPLERRIAVHAVQKVPVAEWAHFGEKMLDMYAARQVDYWELEDAVFPRRFYSHHWSDDFWRPDVRHVLYRFMFVKDEHNDSSAKFICDLLGVEALLSYLFPCPDCPPQPPS
jgi:hypothetical protein